MTSHIEHRGGEVGLVKKPTGFMTSSQFLLKELDKRCPGGHKHVALVGGRASAAQVYPDLLCEAICKGVVQQKAHDRKEMVTTGKLSYTGVRSFLRHMRDLQGSSRNAVERILSTSLVDGTRRPTGEYPENWVDYWH
jgi:hypothetical protein